VAFIVLSTLAIVVSCDEISRTKTEASKVQEEQTLRLTYGGFIQGGPENQRLDGVCGADSNRNAIECDIYNGLPDWNVTELMLRVSWQPYGDNDVRDYRQRVSIAPFTTQKVSVTLGAQLPNDTWIGRERISHWTWMVAGAKGVRASK
jgi:hypothetical protein